jgi:hypothetical protein
VEMRVIFEENPVWEGRGVRELVVVDLVGR